MRRLVLIASFGLALASCGGDGLRADAVRCEQRDVGLVVEVDFSGDTDRLVVAEIDFRITEDQSSDVHRTTFVHEAATASVTNELILEGVAVEGTATCEVESLTVQD